MSTIPLMPALTIPTNVPVPAIDFAWRTYHERLNANGVPPDLSQVVLEALTRHNWRSDKQMRPNLYSHIKRCLAALS